MFRSISFFKIGNLRDFFILFIFLRFPPCDTKKCNTASNNSQKFKSWVNFTRLCHWHFSARNSLFYRWLLFSRSGVNNNLQGHGSYPNLISNLYGPLQTDRRGIQVGILSILVGRAIGSPPWFLAYLETKTHGYLKFNCFILDLRSGHPQGG